MVKYMDSIEISMEMENYSNNNNKKRSIETFQYGSMSYLV